MASEFKSFYPFVGFPTWILKKQFSEPEWISRNEMLLILVLQAFADGMRNESTVEANLETLSRMTSLGKRTIIDTVQLLQDKQLVEKHSKYVDGKRSCNVYTLKIWNLEPPTRGDQEESIGADSALSEDGDLSAGLALTPYYSNNSKNPPISPHQPAASGGSKWQGASPEAIPSELQSISELICLFFNKHKGGQKTRRAFEGQIHELLKIKQDKFGGTDSVKSQLEAAIKRSESGEKRWTSITYENWQRFGMKNQQGNNLRNATRQLPQISATFAEDLV
jgi:hypothetical protein